VKEDETKVLKFDVTSVKAAPKVAAAMEHKKEGEVYVQEEGVGRDQRWGGGEGAEVRDGARRQGWSLVPLDCRRWAELVSLLELIAVLAANAMPTSTFSEAQLMLNIARGFQIWDDEVCCSIVQGHVVRALIALSMTSNQEVGISCIVTPTTHACTKGCHTDITGGHLFQNLGPTTSGLQQQYL